MNRHFLGIDIGGTASRWVVIDEEGTILARGSAPGATGHLFAEAERERFTAVIADIVQAAPAGVSAAHAGVTGLGPKAYGDAQAIVGGQLAIAPKAVSASDDMELAFLSTFAPGGGHLVSAGTGSIGLHLTADGVPIRVGGRGILIDDGGSGTWIALTALNELYRRIDETGGPADAQRLAEALYSAIGGSSWDDVRIFVYGSDRGRIGTLAQAVANAAKAGDPLAGAILRQAASELARLAKALIGRAAILPVAFVGGIIDLHPLIRPGLTEALPGIDVSFPKVDAALRAAQMARTRATKE
jgi:N-acetylglucosamine kinase-like BadF-type ATPase